jgi:predicted nucleic acid-binding protein
LSDRAHLLDTSAIFAFTDNEEGADLVEEYLGRAKKKDISLYVSKMTLMEIYYVSLQKGDEKEARDRLFLVRSLPVTELPLDDDLILPAGQFKARRKISVADAWIAATAAVRNLTLIHKDPEFERVEEDITLLPLPYKAKKGR